MAVELNIVETVTELDTTVVEVILESASTPGPAGPGVPAGGTVNQVLTKDSGTDYDTSWQDPTGGGGGAPTDADYLVGTANGTLSAEIVVGTSPGGELGGTWASPTVDATHSGSSHASVQAAAEATAAAALSTHSADTTGVHGITDTSALALTANHPTNATFNDHSARHENGGADEISLAGLDGTSTELSNHLSDATDAHDASAISVLDSGANYTGTDVEAVLAEIAPQLGGGSGEAMQRSISQTGHGLAVGDVVGFNGTNYVKAQANSAANAEAVGIVAAVPNANTFTLHYGGRITGLSGLTAGQTYFLDDDTAGLLTTTEPADSGDVSKPLLRADSTTSGYFFNWRGVVVADMATQAELDAHISDASDAHDASAVSVLDSGANYTATDVEGVLAEIAPQLGGGSEWTATIRKASTESVTSSAVLQDDDDLQFAVTAGTPYYFELVVIYDGATAGDMRHGFAVASGTVAGSRYHQSAGTTTFVAQYAVIGDLTTTLTCACLGANSPTLLRVQGTFIPSATTTFKFQWAQQVSDATATRVYVGSYLRYRTLA